MPLIYGADAICSSGYDFYPPNGQLEAGVNGFRFFDSRFRINSRHPRPIMSHRARGSNPHRTKTGGCSQPPSALHIPRLPEPPTHDLTYTRSARAAHAQRTRSARASASPRCAGFCVIWDCISSSSSSSPPGGILVLSDEYLVKKIGLKFHGGALLRRRFLVSTCL